MCARTQCQIACSHLVRTSCLIENLATPHIKTVKWNEMILLLPFSLKQDRNALGHQSKIRSLILNRYWSPTSDRPRVGGFNVFPESRGIKHSPTWFRRDFGVASTWFHRRNATRSREVRVVCGRSPYQISRLQISLMIGPLTPPAGPPPLPQWGSRGSSHLLTTIMSSADWVLSSARR